MNIKILHFSDLHFKQNDTKLLYLKDKIIEDINKSQNIDFIIFSGDLLQKPSSDEFKNSFDNFISPFLEKVGVSIDNCFFTIGNHDVDLTKRNKLNFEGLKKYIIEKKDKNVLSDIISGKTELNEFKDYNNFINNLKQNSLIVNNSLFTINKIKIKHIEIGNISINTSLFMEGSATDHGNLYISTDLLLSAYDKIKNCNIKILNLHHPLEWISNKREIEKIIIDKFNLVFFGHEHQHDGVHITDTYNRDILSLNATSLYHPKNEKNGYSLYTYSIDENTLLIEKKEYNKHHNIIETINTNQIENINIMKKAPKAIRNLHISSIIYPNLKVYLNKYLAINLTSEKNKKDIEAIYIHPKVIEEKNDNNENPTEVKSFSLDEIICFKKNIILNGKKESGKTTLLNMLNIKCLLKYHNLIPIYISGNELYSETSIEIFIAKISNYLNDFYANSKLNIKQMIKEERFLFLIDDIHNITSELVEEILKLNNLIISTFVLKEYTIADENLINFDNDKAMENNFLKLEIKPLRKKDNILLTKNIVPDDIGNRISNKVIKTINNLRLPSNPFITTLLSWMYVEKIDIRENEPQIIDVFLDYLLEKAELAKSFNGKFDFNDKKDLLSAIAHLFFLDTSLAIKEDKILMTIIEYSENHFPFQIDARDILEYFYQRRILIKNNNLVQFSYRVFYYYFITLYMINNRDFYNQILSNKLYIINMPDELKYYAALKRDDIDFINKLQEYMIDNKVQIAFKSLSKSEYINGVIKESVDLDTIDEHADEDTDEDTDEDNTKSSVIKDVIDDIETDIRDDRVDTYNSNHLLEKENLKLPKEEFFILNMIFSEFIKHLSGTEIKIIQKEEYFLNSIQNFTNIFQYWQNIFKKDKLLKRFFKIRIPNAKDYPEDKVNELKKLIEISVLSMITNMLELTLSTAKMSQFYLNILNNDNDLNHNFFAIILNIETEEDEELLVRLVNKFINANTNNNLNKLLQVKLYTIMGSGKFKSKTKKDIQKLLVELEFKRNNISHSEKGKHKKDINDFVKTNIEFAKILA